MAESEASGVRRAPTRESTETKASLKSSEFYVYVLAVAAVLIASLLVGGGEGNPDPFDAFDAWRFVTFLTIGYMISRGLAKAGSREPYRD